MPTIKFQVNIEGGKRTGTYISTTSFTDNERVITFINGAVLSELELRSIAHNAIQKEIAERAVDNQMHRAAMRGLCGKEGKKHDNQM